MLVHEFPFIISWLSFEVREDAMFHSTPLVTRSGIFQGTFSWTIEILSKIGMQVVPSFDLQVARASQTNCTCPHHGSAQCSCQMVVLLIYQDGKPPVTLVLHGYDGRTEISLVESINPRVDPTQVVAIHAALLPGGIAASISKQN